MIPKQTSNKFNVWRLIKEEKGGTLSVTGKIDWDKVISKLIKDTK